MMISLKETRSRTARPKSPSGFPRESDVDPLGVVGGCIVNFRNSNWMAGSEPRGIYVSSYVKPTFLQPPANIETNV